MGERILRASENPPNDIGKSERRDKKANELISQVNMVGEILHKRRWDAADRNDGSSPSELDYELEDVLDEVRYEAEDLQDEQVGEEEMAGHMRNHLERYPELFPRYKELLAEAIASQQKKAKVIFEDAEKGKKIDPEIQHALEKKVIRLGKELTPEQIQLLKEQFPTGNFLLHTTSVKEAILIIESGNLLSSVEIAKQRQEEWGRGGGFGISFNMNDVRVLREDSKHLMGFMADPKTVLTDDNRLLVPESAAQFEFRLAPRSYKREYVVSTQGKWGAYPQDEMPRVDVEKMMVFCNELDVSDVIKILAMNGRNPKGIFAYPNREVRIGSWMAPVGDHKEASAVIRDVFEKAEIKQSIDWSKDLFPQEPQIINETMVGEPSIESSYSLIKEEGDLYIDKGNEGLLKIELPKSESEAK